SEGWAFAATFCLDLAVSLLAWDASRYALGEAWWLRLLQINLLSGSVAVLIWVAAGRHYYEERPPALARAPLLSFQLALRQGGVALLLLSRSTLALVTDPGNLPPGVAEAGGVSGWLTLVMTAVVAAVQLRVTRMSGGVNVLGALGAAAGVLAACTAARW